jgi:hypothetical protein
MVAVGVDMAVGTESDGRVRERSVSSCDGRESSRKPNVTPDVDHVDRCIPVLEEWQQLIDRRVRGGVMRCTVALSLSPVMTQQ